MTHIPDEAVQAAVKAYSKQMDYNDNHVDAVKASITSALPHLSAPCAVEVVKLNWQIFCSRSLNREAKTAFGDYVIQNENGVWRLYLPHQEDPHSEFQDDTAAEAAAQADFERRILTCVVTKPVNVAAVREECAEVADKLAGEFMNDADTWNMEKMPFAASHSNSQAKAAHMVSSAIRALPAEPAQGKLWQPIETAPKDGTWIIAIRPKCTFGRWDRVVIVCWSDDFKKWIWPDSRFDVYADDINETDDEGLYTYDPFQSDQFTHWMPLPAAPNTEA